MMNDGEGVALSWLKVCSAFKCARKVGISLLAWGVDSLNVVAKFLVCQPG